MDINVADLFPVQIFLNRDLLLTALFVNILVDACKVCITWRKNIYRLMTIIFSLITTFIKHCIMGSTDNGLYIDTVVTAVLSMLVYDLSGYRYLSYKVREKFGIAEQERRRNNGGNGISD